MSKGLALLGLIALSFLNTDCSSRQPPQEAFRDNTLSTKDSLLLAEIKALPEPTPPKIALFRDVTLLLSKLSVVGIGRMRDWRGDEMGFISSTPYFEFGSESSTNPLRNNLAFYAESPVESRIQMVKIMLNINNDNESDKALVKYDKIASLTLKRLGLTVPKGFSYSLGLGKPYVFENELFSIKNEVHHDRINWYKMTLISK